MAKNGDLQEQMEMIIGEWQKDFDAKAVRSFRQAAELAVRILRETSPKRTGSYAKGWTYTTRAFLGKGASRSRQKAGSFEIGDYVVYNATDWQLTHLLEKGHANPNAGPNARKRTPAHKHIKPAEKTAVEALVRSLKETL